MPFRNEFHPDIAPELPPGSLPSVLDRVQHRLRDPSLQYSQSGPYVGAVRCRHSVTEIAHDSGIWRGTCRTQTRRPRNSWNRGPSLPARARPESLRTQTESRYRIFEKPLLPRAKLHPALAYRV